MRRAVVLVVAAVTLLGGCTRPSPPAGVDSDLVNGWPMLPAATLTEPTAPACYPLPGGTASADVTSWPAAVAAPSRTRSS